uniref:Uncharacterized protein n=1 Tax=Ananas comosus var. bracteatus TaxID=296719 RepID=A0A6V7PXT3_ANACO|nr:unnamed protein product [Ananas comosus var. bracteatus]
MHVYQYVWSPIAGVLSGEKWSQRSVLAGSRRDLSSPSSECVVNIEYRYHTGEYRYPSIYFPTAALGLQWYMRGTGTTGIPHSASTIVKEVDGDSQHPVDKKNIQIIKDKR